ncbi:hypothetical protein ANN_16985 [Periplaneta americana]|uniref:Uncharacterized protein n=1 Tax=Periplaneta americana TaxID=6978 RepID=A0ABQ8SS71_PERAM|nr:hypothetical protein ANN_16985 [Periplaneta americana]
MDLREMGYDDRDWINLTQDRDRWRAYVRAEGGRKGGRERVGNVQASTRRRGHCRGRRQVEVQTLKLGRQDLGEETKIQIEECICCWLNRVQIVATLQSRLEPGINAKQLGIVDEKNGDEGGRGPGPISFKSHPEICLITQGKPRKTLSSMSCRTHDKPIGFVGNKVQLGIIFYNDEVRSEDSPKDYPAFAFLLGKTSEKPNQNRNKKWQVRGDQRKKVAYEARKEEIINKFRTEMDLLVDVKPASGTTNDGNTSRRFFENSKKSSEITGVDEALIHRFSVILGVMSSGYSLNIGAFKKYALDTADLYVKLYGWYYMPATVHKILIHGADVMNNMILPIGQLSEDAQEARHKEYRFF